MNAGIPHLCLAGEGRPSGWVTQPADKDPAVQPQSEPFSPQPQPQRPQTWVTHSSEMTHTAVVAQHVSCCSVSSNVTDLAGGPSYIHFNIH